MKPPSQIVIVIDALDQLETTNAAHDLDWLPAELPAGVRVVCSQINRDGSELGAAWQRRPHLKVEIGELNLEEQIAIIREVPLVSAKALDQTQVRLLLDNPAAAQPLFLLVALEELRGFGAYEQLNERIASFPRGEEAAVELFRQVIDRLEGEFEGDLARWVLLLITASRRGLTESELLDLIGNAPSLAIKSGDPERDRKEDQKDLFVMLRQLRPYLARRGDRIGFYHQALDIAVRRAYFVGEGDRRPMGDSGLYLTTDSRFVAHRHLAAYFGAQSLIYSSPHNRYQYELDKPAIINERLIDELPWHLAEAGDWQSLVTLLCTPPFLNLAYGHDPESFLGFWSRIEADSEHRMVDAYRPLLDNPAPHSTAMTAENLFSVLYAAGYHEDALNWARKLIPLYRRSGDRHSLQKFLTQEAAMSWLTGGSAESALTILAEAEALCHELGLRDELVEVQANRASILINQTGFAAAVTSISSLEDGDNSRVGRRALQHALALRASALNDSGDPVAALELLRQQERICRDFGLGLDLGICLDKQASIERQLGNAGQASRLYVECEAVCRKAGDKIGLARSLHAQAQDALNDGAFDHARQLILQSEEIRREMRDGSALFNTLVLKSSLCERSGEMLEMAGVLRELVQLCRNLGKPELARFSQKLAEACLDAGEFDDALAAYREYEAVCRDLDDAAEVGACRVNQALLLGAASNLKCNTHQSKVCT